MKILAIATLLIAFTVSSHAQQAAKPEEGPYPVHPDSERREGVPRGEVREGSFSDSELYPGTERDYWVYVPAQYDGKTPAALMVFQDGKSYHSMVSTVFDNLIHQQAMPATIAVFVNPGVIPAPHDQAEARYNRSFEYDTVDDRYPRFLIEELLPAALGDLRVTDDPNLRAICGSSSGGIAAFNAAWQRPDAFRRVFTTVGTYVGLRGGNELPVLVRKTEPKPLRVFLQDGRNDNDLYCGSWWVANQDMLSSLQWAGYEVEHEWGEGGHNRKHGNAIFPDVMRWLWQDWATAPGVSTHDDRSKSAATQLLVDGEGWELVSEGHVFTEGPAVNADGELFFSDLEDSKIWRVAVDGTVTLFQENTGNTNGLAFAPDGRTLYGCQREPGRLVAWDLDGGEMRVLAENVKPNDVVVAHDGTIYFSEPRRKAIWMIPSGGGEARIAAEGFSGVNGVVLSADQTQVFVADYGGRFVWSAVRLPDGSLTHLQPYFHLHLPPAAVDVRSHADGMCVTADGWLLVATAMGVQICDQPGRVHLIVPPPIGERHPSNVIFDGDVLYATCGGKVFKRRTQMSGAQPWAAPVKPPKPRL